MQKPTTDATFCLVQVLAWRRCGLQLQNQKHRQQRRVTAAAGSGSRLSTVVLISSSFGVLP